MNNTEKRGLDNLSENDGIVILTEEIVNYLNRLPDSDESKETKKLLKSLWEKLEITSPHFTISNSHIRGQILWAIKEIMIKEWITELGLKEDEPSIPLDVQIDYNLVDIEKMSNWKQGQNLEEIDEKEIIKILKGLRKHISDNWLSRPKEILGLDEFLIKLKKEKGLDRSKLEIIRMINEWLNDILKKELEAQKIKEKQSQNDVLPSNPWWED